MIAITNDVVTQTNQGGGWLDMLDRVLSGVSGAVSGANNPNGQTPVVYGTNGPAGGAAAVPDYTPLILIALVVVAIVVLSK